MDPRMWRMFIAIVVTVLLALIAFTFMLRQYARELAPRQGGETARLLVRRPGAPPLREHVRRHMENQGIVVEEPPATNSPAHEGTESAGAEGTNEAPPQVEP